MQKIFQIKNKINEEASKFSKLGTITILSITIDVIGNLDEAVDFLKSDHGGYTEFEINRALYLKKYHNEYYQKNKSC